MSPRGDHSKTKAQLIDELNDLRDKLVKLVSLSELEAIFKVLPDVYFRFDREGTILDFKTGEHKDLFAKPEEFLGKRFDETLPPEAAGKIKKAIDEAMTFKRLAIAEYTLQLPHGKQYYEARVFPLDIEQLVAIVRNITSNKMLELESTRLQSFPELSPNPVIETDGQGLLTSMNPAARKVFPGIKKGTFTHPVLEGLTSLTKKPGKARKLAIREVLYQDRVYEQHASYIPEIDRIRVYINDITVRKQVEEALQNHRDHLQVLVDERTVELETINQQLQEEIAERERFETGLKASEENYRLLFALGNDAKFVHPISSGLPGTFTDVNDIACKSLEYSREELLELTPGDIARHFDPDGVQRNSEKLVKNGTAVFEAYHIKKDGNEFPVEISAQLFYQNDEPMVVSIARDITGRKKAEEDLKKAKEAAESANRLKSQFLANMSHDIRTPLNAVLGFADLMLKNDLDVKSRSYLKKIIDSGDGLLTLLNDILDFSKIEAGQLDIFPQPFSFNQVLTHVQSAFDLQFKRKGIGFYIEAGPGIPEWVYGDKWRILQVLNNLVSNALKFTEHGSVKIKAWFDVQSDRLFLEVADTGLGIPVENREDIFQPFTQVQTPEAAMKGGTGIGLAICRNLAALMGGSLTVESQLYRGSVFLLTIPANSGKVPEAPLPATVSMDVTVGLERKLDNQILVVDDNLVNLELIIEQLRKEGFHFLLPAHNGREAIELAVNYSPDLILIDIQMPDMSGNEAIKKLRGHGCQTPIIALSAYAMQENIDETIACGANDYITKPIDFKRLFVHINRFLKVKQANGRTAQPPGPQNGAGAEGNRTPYEISPSVSDRIRSIFLKDSRKKVLLLNDVIEAGELGHDKNTIKVIAHNYKGNAGFLGLEFLAELSCKMDDAFKNNEPESTLMDYTRKLAAILSKVIETNPE